MNSGDPCPLCHIGIMESVEGAEGDFLQCSAIGCPYSL